MVATCSAWKRRSASVHCARDDDDRRDAAQLGGDRLLELRTVLAATRGARGIRPVDGPHTIASNVGAAPVMWTWSMPGCSVRYAPTSGPPRTMRTKPGSMSGASARSNTGTSGVLGRVQLEQRDAVVRQQLVQHVEHRDRGDVAGAEDEPDAAGLSSATSWPGRRCGAPRRSVTPGSNHTSPVKPESSRPSTGLSGKTCARTRPPGAASSFTPSSGLSPFASFSSGRGRPRARPRAVGAGEPVLTAERMPGLEALRRRGDIRPLGGDRRHRGVQALHQARALVQREVASRSWRRPRVPRSRRRAPRARARRGRRPLRGFRPCGQGRRWRQPGTRALSFGRELSVYVGTATGTESQAVRPSMSERRSG